MQKKALNWNSPSTENYERKLSKAFETLQRLPRWQMKDLHKHHTRVHIEFFAAKRLNERSIA